MNERRVSEKDAAKVAGVVRSIYEELPDGVELVVFVLTDIGPAFEAVVAASISPDAFAPVIRRWLERYDAGEAGGMRVEI
jgi:hypothetical protein